MAIEDDVKIILHSTGAAAGQTLVEPGKGVDTLGFDGVAFLVVLGAVDSLAVTSINAQTSDDDGDADAYADVKGSKITVADTGDNKLYVLDVRHPSERYVRCVVSRGTADSAVICIVALLYDARNRPITQDSDTASVKAVADAIAGTP
jgi:hypothetical protein